MKTENANQKGNKPNHEKKSYRSKTGDCLIVIDDIVIIKRKQTGYIKETICIYKAGDYLVVVDEDEQSLMLFHLANLLNYLQIIE